MLSEAIEIIQNRWIQNYMIMRLNIATETIQNFIYIYTTPTHKNDILHIKSHDQTYTFEIYRNKIYEQTKNIYPL